MNLFRVSLIGTGGGYGESVVVQLGLNNWIVVDSCIDPVTKESLPLEYLKSLGVQIETEVKLKANIVKIELSEKDGKIKKTFRNSHYSWWRSSLFDVSQSKTVEL